MKTFLKSLLAVGAVALVVSCGDTKDQPANAGDRELVMFCAAGMKKPVTKIAEQYEAEYGVPVTLRFDGSGTLLTTLEIADGDIYLAADSSYTDIAREKGLLAETMPVAIMRAGFGVPKGNPKGITQLSQVQDATLSFGICNPDAASVGKFTRKILSKQSLWDGFDPTVQFPTVTELANSLKLGTVDAVIMWDAVAHQYDEIEFVNLPEFDVEEKDITIGVLRASRQATEALRFCRYLTARDQGLKIFAADGYQAVEGDEWAEHPEVLLFSGSMLRPAIEKTIERFEQREGVTITPVYNGCGILVSQMKAGANPDGYFSCDIEFMEMVQERFSESTLVTANEMVILVEKGNPKGVKSLDDLLKPGVQVGLSHPDKSALGALTRNLLEKVGMYQKLLDSGNVMDGAATGDFLVNQVRAASLDAVIVYRSNAMSNKGTETDCDLVEIDHPEAIAEQPYAIGKGSRHRHLLQRFFDACVTEQGKEGFLKYGFRWELEGSGEEKGEQQ